METQPEALADFFIRKMLGATTEEENTLLNEWIAGEPSRQQLLQFKTPFHLAEEAKQHHPKAENVAAIKKALFNRCFGTEEE